MYNFAPRPVPPHIEAATTQSIETMRDSGFTDEELVSEQLPLLASTVITRSSLPLVTRRERRAASRLVGVAIGNHLSQRHGR
jgi:hypothetical protein